MSSTPGSYLETEVMTAPPQKLQLMMIDAAIRFARRAEDQWEHDQNDLACESLIRSQQVVTELINGLNREESPKLVGKIASVYLFVFRHLMEASVERSVTKLREAISVLQEERETWRQVCEQIGVNPPDTTSTLDLRFSDPLAPPIPSVMPAVIPNTGYNDSAVGGFSIDA